MAGGMGDGQTLDVMTAATTRPSNRLQEYVSDPTVTMWGGLRYNGRKIVEQLCEQLGVDKTRAFQEAYCEYLGHRDLSSYHEQRLSADLKASDLNGTAPEYVLLKVLGPPG